MPRRPRSEAPDPGASPVIEACDTEEALAREMALLGQVSDAPAKRFLWFWSAPQSLVAPRKLGSKPRFRDAAVELAKDGWPVFLRGTGGDVTPQGPGIVNVTHVYAGSTSRTFDLDAEYDRLCTPIETALGPGASRGWQPGAFCDGAHNVQWSGRKFAGTAMRFRPCRADRSRHAVMAHALLLIEPPSAAAIAAINRFLSALHEPRVIDPAAHTGLPPALDKTTYLSRLERAFQAMDDLPPVIAPGPVAA